MIQRTVPATQTGSGAHGPMHEVERILDGRVQLTSEGETGRDRRGEGATRPVRGGGGQSRPGESPGTPGADQDVGHHIALQMSALDQRRAGAEFEEPASRALHLVGVHDLEAGENAGLIEIRGDEAGKRKQPLPHDGFGGRIEQAITRGGHHDGIADIGAPAAIPDGIGDLLDQRDRGEHARLHCGRREVLGEGIELRSDHCVRDGVHGADAASILRGQRHDHRRAEDAELLERLEIGLDAGTAPRVRSGNGERDFHMEGVVAVSLISTIRDLHRRRARDRRSLTLVEGVRLLEEALAAGIVVQGAATSAALEATPRGAALKRRLVLAGVPIEAVDDDLLIQLADTEQPQGVVAVVEARDWALDAIQPGAHGVVLVLDGVQDPGNVGALARTALGLGAVGLVALPGTADISNPKALRGSMGALFRLPTVQATTEAFIGWARGSGLSLWTTAADGAPVDRVRREGPIALILGNEGAGVRPELAAAAAQSVSVPLAGGVESLNVAVAAGIILYEVTRDR